VKISLQLLNNGDKGNNKDIVDHVEKIQRMGNENVKQIIQA
jgi:hypothetical protein